jgi:hypothetical protein
MLSLTRWNVSCIIVLCVLSVLLAACQIFAPVPTATQNSDALVETKVAATITAGQYATAAVEQAVRLTLTAVASSSTITLPPSITLGTQATMETTPQTNIDAIAGDWTGALRIPDTGESVGFLDITILPGCSLGKICGTYFIPPNEILGLGLCSGNLVLTEISGETFTFEQQLTQGDLKFCGTGSYEKIKLLEDGTLSQTWSDGTANTYSTLTRK